jgi:predicted MFS family arabinose efflux permease
MNSLTKTFSKIPHELKLFAAASLVMGVAYSVMDSTFNNFLNERFSMSGFQRSFLEFPRELPGLSVIFVSALLWFLCSRRLGAWSLVIGAVGTILIGFAAPGYYFMVVWLFIYSLGQHVFMPLASSIGMELASEGKAGRRLGQLNALRNLAAIGGSFLVFVGFKYFNFNFHYTFIITAVGLAIAAVLMFMMKPQKVNQKASTYLSLHKEYRLYYLLAVLYGTRKQLFITFAPWVLVTIFKEPTSTLATLITIGGIIGILFQPLLGWAIDHLGERFVLTAEAILLAVVCLGYGFARTFFPETAAFYIVCACYLVDQMLMSVNMARATYMKKIALRSEDIQPALTVGVSIDHIFSISIALIGGLIWNVFGYQYVFLLGMVIAVVNFVVALQIRLPKPAAIQTAVEAVTP